MALRLCTGCTTAYSVGAPRCPQCGSTDFVEEGQPMPKITVHGGPSHAAADAEGGEQSSPGSSSETSSAKAPSSPEPSETPGPSRARPTANRSKKARTGSSSAAGTDGDRAAGTSETGSADKEGEA